MVGTCGKAQDERIMMGVLSATTRREVSSPHSFPRSGNPQESGPHPCREGEQ